MHPIDKQNSVKMIAFVLNRASITGRIEPGAIADLILVDHDPRSLSPAELHAFAPTATMLAGRWVHGRSA